MANWRVTQRQIIILLPVYVNSLFLGCTEGWLSNAVYFFQQEGSTVSATVAECTWIASMTEIGRFFFAIPSGLMLDKYGRKHILFGIGVLNFLPWVVLSISTSLLTIYIVRFFMGINHALVNASGNITIAEMVSPEIRGKLVVLRQVFYSCGTLLQCLISVIFSSYTTLNYITCVLSTSCLISLFWLFETPHHLIRSSKYEQARWTLVYVRPNHQEEQINREFHQLIQYIDAEKKLKTESSWLKFMRKKSIRGPITTMILLEFFQNLIGTAVVSAYITIIIPSNVHIPKQYYPLIIFTSTVFSRAFTSLFIDRFPRRKLYMCAGFCTCIMQLCNALNYYLYKGENWQLCFWIFALGNVLVRMFITGWLSPVTNTVKSEILPQMVKGFGTSLCSLGVSFSSVIGYQLFQLMQFRLYFLYVFYAISSCVMVFVVYFRVPEGRAKTLVDIQNVNYRKVPIVLNA